MASKFSATIPIGDFTPQQFLMLVSNAFVRLGWKQQSMEEDSITAATSMSTASWGEDITVTINGNEAEILSKCSGKQIIDWGKNKKNVNKLTSAIEELRHTYTPLQLDEQLSVKRTEAEQALAAFEERFQQGKLTAIDKLSIGQGGYYVTHTLIALNVLVFIAMVIGGVSFINPSAADLLIWGGNNRVYTASGDWWRLITSMFLHGGIIHLLFNMYALFSVGIYLEPIMGRGKFLAAYLATGVMASVASIWWNDNTVSVGASGAIFGMYGLFLALLTTNYLDKHVRKLLLQSIIIFVGYNLVYGLKEGIDNAAHIGGLVSGFILGYIFYYLHVKQPRPQWFIGAAAVLALAVAVPSLNGKRDDTMKFGRIWDEFAALETQALAPLNESENMSDAEFVNKAQTISMPAWLEMKKLMERTQKYHLPPNLVTERKLMNKYVDLRIQYTQTQIQMVKNNDEKLLPKLNSIANELKAVLDELQKN